MDGSGPPNGSGDAPGSSGEGPSPTAEDRAGTAALHGLLRSLGAGLDDMFPMPSGTSHSRLRAILSTLRSTTPDATAQLDALTQLCDYLSVGTEESMVSFSIDAFVPPLVSLLSDGTADTKLLSARAITHMMDALPTAAASISHHGAAVPLCANLLSIQYIDLAEQSLSALEKLSTDFPHPIVRAGGFSAALSFIDFFSTGVQRVAASTVCNLCRGPPSEAMDMVVEVLPTMRNLLDSLDQRIREYTIQGFSRLADGFRGSSSKLEQLCSENAVLVDKVLGLVVPASPPALTPSFYASALHLLATLARGSVVLSEKLMNTNSLIMKMKSRLENAGSSHALDYLAVADALLPDSGDPEDMPVPTSRSRRRRSNASVMSALAAIDVKRRASLEKDSAPLEKFGKALFLPLMRFYVSSADVGAKQHTLSVLSKLVSIAPDHLLDDLILSPQTSEADAISDVSFCPFVSTLISENSSHNEAHMGLSLANSALTKVPEVKKEFVREGVMHEILRLAALAPKKEDEEANTANAANAAVPSTRAIAGTTASSVRIDGNADGTPVSRGLRHLAGLEIRDRALRSGSNTMGRHTSSSRGAAAAASAGARSSTDPAVASRLAIHVGSFRPMSSEAKSHAVSKRALKLVNTHLSDESGNGDPNEMKSQVLLQLIATHDDLQAAAKSPDISSGLKAMDELIRSIADDSGISVYEFSRSKIADALFEYLVAEDWSSTVRTERCVAFVDAMNKYATKKPFLLLVRRLLGAFSSEEKLPVQINETGSSGSSVNSGLRQLSQPFKLKLRRGNPEGNSSPDLKDYSHHIVLIEPLATMSSVEDFLWPRVSSGPASSRFRGRSRHSAPADVNDGGDGGHTEDLDSDHIDEEMVVGSEDGHEATIDGDGSGENDEEMEAHFNQGELFDIDDDAAEQMDTAAAEEEEEQVQHESNSDEEMSSASDDVIEQDGDGEEMDTDGPGFGLETQLVGSLPAFELDDDALAQITGASIRRPGSTDGGGELSRSRQASASAFARALSSGDVAAATAMRSYAAALAGSSRAHARSSAYRSATTQASGESSARRSSRLNFSLNNIPIPSDRSILSAVVRGSRRSHGVGPKLWSEVHTLTYRRAKPTATPAARSQGAGASSSAAPTRRSSRLRGSNSAPEPVVVAAPLTPASTEISAKVLDRIMGGNMTTSVPEYSKLDHLPGEAAKYVSLLKYLKWIQEHRDPRNSGGHAIALSSECGSDIDFISHKITSKVKRQVSDPLALCGSAVPRWCFSVAKQAPFLMPFETRRVLFQSTALGMTRALHLLQAREDMANTNSGVSSNSQRSMRRESETRISRIQRSKVRIYRNRMLESALRVMSLYATNSTILEVEYFEEVGTGLGPTLEFYTLASREAQRLDLQLWRSKNTYVAPDPKTAPTAPRRSARGSASRSSRRKSRGSSPKSGAEGEGLSNENVQYVESTGHGLFPAPTISLKKGNLGTVEMFTFIGRLVGKGLADGRLLDLRFSRTFCELLLAFITALGEMDNNNPAAGGNDDGVFHPIGSGDSATTGNKLKSIDSTLLWEKYCSGRPVLAMLRDVDPQLASSLQSMLTMLTNGHRRTVSSLCLSYTLPGNDSVELVPKGAELEVTADNLEDYVARVAYHVLFAGVRKQAEALLIGFSEVLDLQSLSLFQANELEMLICGPSHEDWSVEFLVQATRCDHGFRHESEAVLTLFKVLSELSPDDQRRFVLFVTGSPALPLGGLRNLNPRLTIVKRTPEAGRSPDECLPTVMTCTNYLKLPDYSNYELAKERIMYAIQEGQGSFHLS